MQFVIIGIFVVGFTALICALEHYSIISKFNNIAKQIIYGLVFALISIISTNLGYLTFGVNFINATDAVIIVASLLFGPLTGILAVIINLVYNLFCSLYYTGAFIINPVFAITLVFAAIFPVVINMIFHKNFKLTYLNVYIFVVIVEIIHLLLMFVYQINDLENALINIVYAFVPLFTANITVSIFAFFVYEYICLQKKDNKLLHLLEKSKLKIKKTIFQFFQSWLILIFVAIFALNIYVLVIFYEMTCFTNAQYHYYDELTTINELIEKDQLFENKKNTSEIAIDYAKSWSGTNGVSYMVVKNNGDILFDSWNMKEVNNIIKGQPQLNLIRENVSGEIYYIMYLQIQDFNIVTYIPEKIEMFTPYVVLCIIVIFEFIIFTLLMLAIFNLLKRLVTKKLDEVNNSLDEITNGNLNKRVNVYSTIEFAKLSSSINSTVDTLNIYIEEETNRYNSELEMAKQIQFSSLPNVFPPFPNTPQIDFYSLYKPAKIVGGDFYDYFYVGVNKLAFLIADVSGKSIPSAMFMMRAKTAFRTVSADGKTPAKILKKVNNYLCEDNDTEMFVTAWLGIVDIKTGNLQYASAGHNPPYIIDGKSGKTSILKSKPGLVLGAMENINYKNYTIKLSLKDKLFLYTDGVVEAHDKDNKLYGENRLKDFLDKNSKLSIKDICTTLIDDIEKFSGEQEQFDDCSLVCFVFNGDSVKTILKQNYWEYQLNVLSDKGNINSVLSYCENAIKTSNAPNDYIRLFGIFVDEIFSNIMKYSYVNKKNYISIRIVVDERSEDKFVSIEFIDNGKRFNPLDQPAPDITLSLDERDIGGLGIFIVNNLTDEMKYEYKNCANHLTIVKYY